MNNDPSPTHVASTSDHGNVSSVELHEFEDLILNYVKFDGVVDSDERIGIANRAAIMGDDVWYTLGANGNFFHLQKLVGCLLRCDAVDSKTTFDVVQKTEMLARLLNR